VSRWSAERLRIGLAPERVDVARLAPRFGRGAAIEHSVACAPRAGQPPWQAALDALDALLTELGSPKAAVAVVLSNHWARYAVLPWQPELLRPAEIEQLARLRFEQTLGPAAAGWTIRTRDGGYGAAHVACAVDSALIDELRTRLAAHGLRLASVQPLLMAAYNEERRGFNGASAFAIVERGRVCVSLLNRGRWVEITSRRAGDDPAETIEQEMATWDAATVPAQLDVLLVGDDVSWRPRGDRPARLLGAADASGLHRSLAMVGAG
jgi:hypothetical protein